MIDRGPLMASAPRYRPLVCLWTSKLALPVCESYVEYNKPEGANHS